MGHTSGNRTRGSTGSTVESTSLLWQLVEVINYVFHRQDDTKLALHIVSSLEVCFCKVGVLLWVSL